MLVTGIDKDQIWLVKTMCSKDQQHLANLVMRTGPTGPQKGIVEEPLPHRQLGLSAMNASNRQRVFDPLITPNAKDTPSEIRLRG